MNEGISFNEACAKTPSGLTNEQLENCPGVTTNSEWAMYVLIAVLVVSMLIGFYLWSKKKSKTNS
jgi:hypothetical protein